MKHALTHLSKSASDQPKRRQPSPPKTSPHSSHSSHTKKPTNSYLGIKSSIMVLSIVGTMSGWLFLLETEGLVSEGVESQGLSSQQVASQQPSSQQLALQVSEPAESEASQVGAELMTVGSMNINYENSDLADAPRAVDISKLRRVNDNEVMPIADANPVTPVKVVARTRSSR